MKLLNPREVVQRVLDSYQNNALDLAAVEGFIRQVIGWREFVRGVYYLDMPQMAAANFTSISDSYQSGIGAVLRI